MEEGPKGSENLDEKPYSLDDLKDMVTSFYDESFRIGKIFEENKHKNEDYLEQRIDELKSKGIDPYIDGDPYNTIENYDRQDYLIGMIDKLKKGKDSFKYIFETEKGSTYFVLPTGESLRFKKLKSGLCESELVISAKIIFINESDFNKFVVNKVLTQDIPIIEPKEGAIPIEIGQIKSEGDENDRNPQAQKIDYKIDGDNIKINILQLLRNEFHIGHKITKIEHEG